MQKVDGDTTHIGGTIEPTIWSAGDDRTRIYLLAGVGYVSLQMPALAGTAVVSASETGTTFQVGVGGLHDVTPGMAVGFELFAQTDLVGDYTMTATYVALTGTLATDRGR